MLMSWFVQVIVVALVKPSPGEAVATISSTLPTFSEGAADTMDTLNKPISAGPSHAGTISYLVQVVPLYSEGVSIDMPGKDHSPGGSALLETKQVAGDDLGLVGDTENTARRLLGLALADDNNNSIVEALEQVTHVTHTTQDVGIVNEIPDGEISTGHNAQHGATERSVESALLANQSGSDQLEYVLDQTSSIAPGPETEAEKMSDTENPMGVIPLFTSVPQHGDSGNPHVTAVTPSVEQSSESNVNCSGTTMRPLAERECIAGFVCLHGWCKLRELRCHCDPGWFGPVCGVTCVPACNALEHCQTTDDDLWNPVCVCDPSVTGSCRLDGTYNYSPTNPPPSPPPITLEPSNDTITTTTVSSLDVVTEIDPHSGIWEPLEGYGPLAPLSWRICAGSPPLFECRYGNCSFENATMHCKCEANFTDHLCDKPCLLECGDLGVCVIQDSTGREDCLCHDHHYRGFNCSTLYQPHGSSELLSREAQAAVGVVAVLVIMLMMLLLTLYLLWRKRNITMMKIVYWFQSFEEDDDRDWDAFVSYASSDLDRDFVVQVLVPRLEGRMCFSLCLHQRDFLPGQYISNNISQSVKRSRRTIMVLSPAYVKSDWCKFEFQMALQEMVSQKHRILPILLDDVRSLKKDMDETLRKVLEAVTWIEYPGCDSKEKEVDQFWKRIALSMPKKRPISVEHGENNSSYTSLTALSLSTESVRANSSGNKNHDYNFYLDQLSCQSSEIDREQQTVQAPANPIATSDFRSSERKKKSFIPKFLRCMRGESGDSKSHQPRVEFSSCEQDAAVERVRGEDSTSKDNTKTERDKLKGCHGDRQDLQCSERKHKVYRTMCEHASEHPNKNFTKDKTSAIGARQTGSCHTTSAANPDVQTLNSVNSDEKLNHGADSVLDTSES